MNTIVLHVSYLTRGQTRMVWGCFNDNKNIITKKKKNGVGVVFVKDSV